MLNERGYHLRESQYIGVGRFRILGGGGLEYCGDRGGRGQIPSRLMTW